MYLPKNAIFEGALNLPSFLLLKKKALPEKKEIGDDFDLVE